MVGVRFPFLRVIPPTAGNLYRSRAVSRENVSLNPTSAEVSEVFCSPQTSFGLAANS